MSSARYPSHNGTAVLPALVALAACPAFAAPPVDLYPPTPLATFDDDLSCTVNGIDVRLETQRVRAEGKEAFFDSSRARFASKGPVRCSLKAPGKALERAALRTIGRDLAVAVRGGGLSFTLPGPGHYLLKTSGPGGFGRTVLLWVDAPPAKAVTAADPGVIDVTTRGVVSDPETVQTAAIQSLLDACSAKPDGGTLLFPAGVYRSGTLRVGSNTTLHLDRGALLKGADGERHFDAAFLLVKGARNVRFAGVGTVDANGIDMQKDPPSPRPPAGASADDSVARRPRITDGIKIHNVNVEDSTDVAFEDLLFRDSNSWAIHLIRSENVRIRNVKVFSGKDGFDPDSSRDVTIEDVFVQSMDDGIAVKARTRGRACERIAFRRAMVSSVKSALKIGTETRAPVRDVTFEDCEVYDTDRGIVLYAHDGGDIERATWRNIRMELVDIPSESRSGTPFDLRVVKEEGVSRVADCRIENVTTNILRPSVLAGLTEAPLGGIAMKGVTILAGPPKSGKPFLFEGANVADVRIDGLKVEWRGHQERWAGVASIPGIKITK